MNNKIIEILTLVSKINKIEGIDAFFDFHGHVNEVTVSVNHNADYTIKNHNRILGEYVYLDNDDAEKKLEKMLFNVQVVNEMYKNKAVTTGDDKTYQSASEEMQAHEYELDAKQDGVRT